MVVRPLHRRLSKWDHLCISRRSVSATGTMRRVASISLSRMAHGSLNLLRQRSPLTSSQLRLWHSGALDKRHACLEQRLGRLHARLRQGIETDHEAQVFGQGINYFHVENCPDIPTAFDGFIILHLTDLHVDINQAAMESLRRRPKRMGVHPRLGAYRSDVLLDELSARQRWLRQPCKHRRFTTPLHRCTGLT